MTVNKSGETGLKRLKQSCKEFLENAKKGKQASGAAGGGCPSLSDVDLPPQFLLIFHKAAAGELQEESGLTALAKLSEIDVALEGVKGAKNFFEAKVGRSPPPCILPNRRAQLVTLSLGPSGQVK